MAASALLTPLPKQLNTLVLGVESLYTKKAACTCTFVRDPTQTCSHDQEETKRTQGTTVRATPYSSAEAAALKA